MSKANEINHEKEALKAFLSANIISFKKSIAVFKTNTPSQKTKMFEFQDSESITCTDVKGHLITGIRFKKVKIFTEELKNCYKETLYNMQCDFTTKQTLNMRNAELGKAHSLD